MAETSNDPFLSYVLSSKQLTNLNRLRRKAVTKQLGSSDDNKVSEEFLRYQHTYQRKAFEYLQTKHDAHKIMESQYEQYQSSSKTRRYSIDLDSVDAVDTESQTEYPNEEFIDRNEDSEAVMELRKRLLGKGQNKGLGYETTK